MAHPTDLAVNDRITTVIGDFTVVEVYPRLSADDPIEVDVTPGPGVEVWDLTTLALVLGAQSAGWMSGARHPRFRVYFAAHRNVAVVDGGRDRSKWSAWWHPQSCVRMVPGCDR